MAGRSPVMLIAEVTDSTITVGHVLVFLAILVLVLLALHYGRR